MAKQHHTKEFRLMRSVALWLHDSVCYLCKHKFETLEVHHADKNSSNNILSNLTPVCPDCHKFAHRTSAIFSVPKKTIIVLLLRKIAQLS